MIQDYHRVDPVGVVKKFVTRGIHFQWLKATHGMERHFYHAISPISSLEQFCQRLRNAGCMALPPAKRFTLRPNQTHSQHFVIRPKGRRFHRV